MFDHSLRRPGIWPPPWPDDRGAPWSDIEDRNSPIIWLGEGIETKRDIQYCTLDK